jgi:tetratricopeptide (TPR) repeat protein
MQVRWWWLKVGLCLAMLVFLSGVRLANGVRSNWVNVRQNKMPSGSLDDVSPYQDSDGLNHACLENLTSLRMRAHNAATSGNAHEALRLLDACRALKISDDFLLLDLGWVYWKIGDHTSAESVWKSLARKQPAVLLALCDSVGVQDSFYSLPDTKETWRTVASVGAESVHVAPEQADLYVLMRQIFSDHLQNPAQGMQWLNLALENGVKDWQVYWLLYADAITLGKYAKAQGYLEQAWAQDPNGQFVQLDGYYWRLGSILLRQQRLDEAIVWFQDCLALNPDSFQCGFELGETLFYLRRYTESLEVYKSIDLGSLDTIKRDITLRRIQQIEQDFNGQPIR